MLLHVGEERGYLDNMTSMEVLFKNLKLCFFCLAIFTIQGISVWGSKVVYKWYKEVTWKFPGLKLND